MMVGIFLIVVAALGAVMGLLISRRLEPKTFALLAAVRNQGWTDENRARLNRFRHTARKAARMAPRSVRDMPIADRRLDSMPWMDVLARLLADLWQAESMEATQGHNPTMPGLKGRKPPSEPPTEDGGMGESHLSRLEPDLCMIGIGRDKVESNDIRFALSTLADSLSTPRRSGECKGR